MAKGLPGLGWETASSAVGGRVAAVATFLFFFASRVPDGMAVYAPSPGDEGPQFCTVFNHMVKSGGTTIKTQLEKSSEVEGDAFPGLCTFGGGFDTPDSCHHALVNSSVITGYGELLRDPLQRQGRSCEFFTMMRHPVSRLVSAFYFCPDDDRLNRPAKWCGGIPHRIPATVRLLEFATKSMYSRLAFTEMLFGLRCPPGFSLCDPNKEPVGWVKDMRTEEGREALFRMQENLRSYKAIGIFEHWDLSMQLFDATVTSSVRHWDENVVLNAGPAPPERLQVLKWAHESPEIHMTLATDILIYQYCLSMFKHQTREVLGTEWTS